MTHRTNTALYVAPCRRVVRRTARTHHTPSRPHTSTAQVLAYMIPGCLNPIAKAPGTNLLVLDSPGLFAPNRHPLFDAQLLAVFNMLSSVVVYNTGACAHV